MAGGRPPLFSSPEEFETRANEYFDTCNGRPTVSGLCLALGVSSRQTLLNYEGKPEFLDVVKTARLKLENAWESALSESNVAGTIFWLKNQGWSDKTEHELHGPGKGPIETVTRFTLADLE